MDSQYIRTILIMTVGLVLALILGMSVATAQRDAIMWVGLAVTILILLALGKHVWALIPVAAVMAGGLNFLPGSPPAWWGALGAAGGMLVLRFLLRSNDLTWRWTWIDTAILLQVIALAQAYIRNPTGFAVFGGAVAGGRTYVAYAFAIAGYYILSMIKTDLRTVRIVVFAMLAAAFLDGMLMVVSQYVPRLAMMVLPVYSGVVFTAAVGMEESSTMESRIQGGKDVGVLLGQAAFSFYPPFSTLNPLFFGRFLLAASAAGFVLISGFRSAFGMLLLFFLVGLIVRRQWTGLLFSAMVAGVVLIAVGLAGDAVQKLPFGAKRILSVIPYAQVEKRIRQNAIDSSTWRFEMWELALTTDRYITNKWLGDGFNLSASELRAVQDTAYGDRRRTMNMSIQDIMLERGSYHGFHVETIRHTGVLGLVCALVGMGILFKQSLKLINYFRGRKEWGIVLFLCIPYLIHPFYYMIVFGSYKVGFNIVLLMAGMLKILDTIRVRELAAQRETAGEKSAEAADTHGWQPMATRNLPQAAPFQGNSR